MTKKTKADKGKIPHATGRAKGKNKIETRVILEAIKDSGAIISTISEKLGISRATFYRYMETIPEVREAVADEKESMLDLAEDSLFGLIQDGDLGAICFFLKCKGKGRGYVEKSSIDHTSSDGSMSPAPALDLSKMTPQEIHDLAKIVFNGK